MCQAFTKRKSKCSRNAIPQQLYCKTHMPTTTIEPQLCIILGCTEPPLWGVCTVHAPILTALGPCYSLTCNYPTTHSCKTYIRTFTCWYITNIVHTRIGPQTLIYCTEAPIPGRLYCQDHIQYHGKPVQVDPSGLESASPPYRWLSIEWIDLRTAIPNPPTYEVISRVCPWITPEEYSNVNCLQCTFPTGYIRYWRDQQWWVIARISGDASTETMEKKTNVHALDELDKTLIQGITAEIFGAHWLAADKMEIWNDAADNADNADNADDADADADNADDADADADNADDDLDDEDDDIDDVDVDLNDDDDIPLIAAATDEPAATMIVSEVSEKILFSRRLMWDTVDSTAGD